MLTSKQRAYLRSLATELPSMVQVGKSKMDENLLQTLENYFLRHELIKINLLKTSEEDPRALANILAKDLEAEVVSVIGRKIVLYRYSKYMAERGEEITFPF